MRQVALNLKIDPEQIILGDYRVRYSNVDGRVLNIYVDIQHKGLNKYKEVSGKNTYILENRLQSLINHWEDEWNYELEKRAERKKIEDKFLKAKQLTEDAQKLFKEIENTLKFTLKINDAVDWKSLENNIPFSIKKPEDIELLKLPDLPEKRELYNIETYNYSLFERIFPYFKKKKQNRIIEENKYINDLNSGREKKYKKEVFRIEQENNKIIKENKENLDRWANLKLEYEKKQKEHNKKIKELEIKYKNGDHEAIETNCELILINSKHIDFVEKKFDIEYTPENQTLVVDYMLPAISKIPKTKEIIYIKSKSEMKETYYSDSEINKLYDSFIYQLSLRSVHELFEGDVIDAIKLITFNGWVKAINKATGNEETNCIVSLTTTKEKFLKINLANVDPKECFKSLKGVSASKLYTMTAVNPIMHIKKEDKRFIDSYEVMNKVEEGDNLAIMDWEDFEHLVRELFEKEFSQEGAEIKVTRTSKDGGVDVVILDPDPIKGGKIVVQAKRYTNVVGVAAVRDLYGTVVNEGANKGILVTTSQYGADSYEFAKDKPIILIDGGNLLALLEKHGQKARINLKEAKQYFKDKENL